MGRRRSGHPHMLHNGAIPMGRRVSPRTCKPPVDTICASIGRGGRFADFTRSSGVCIPLPDFFRSPLPSLPGPAAQLKTGPFAMIPNGSRGRQPTDLAAACRSGHFAGRKNFRAPITKSSNRPTGNTPTEPSVGRIATLVRVPSGCRFPRPVLPHGDVQPVPIRLMQTHTTCRMLPLAILRTQSTPSECMRKADRHGSTFGGLNASAGLGVRV